MMKNYETYIIFDGNLEDNTIEELIIKYENILKKNDAEIKNTDRIGRRRLAFAIKKKLNGYYVCFEFLSGPDQIAKIEKVYKLDENVIRYLTFAMDKKSIIEKEDYFKKKLAFAEKLEVEKTESIKEEHTKLVNAGPQPETEAGRENTENLKN